MYAQMFGCLSYYNNYRLDIADADDILMFVVPIDRIELMRDSLSRNVSPVSGSTFHSTRVALSGGGGGKSGVPMLGVDMTRSGGSVVVPGWGRYPVSVAISNSVPPSGFVMRRAQQWW